MNIDLKDLKVNQFSSGIIYNNQIMDIDITYDVTDWDPDIKRFDGEIEIHVYSDDGLFDGSTGGLMRYQFGDDLTLRCIEFIKEYIEMLEDEGEMTYIDYKELHIIVGALESESRMVASS